MHDGANKLATGTATDFVNAMQQGTVKVLVAEPGQAIRF
jgi:hypothetical protein